METNKKSISIILPTKNHEESVVNNIDGLKNFLSNNFENFEILILSNGSISQNIDLLKKAKIFDDYVKFFLVESVGKGNAVKFGINIAAHDNLVIFDADFSYDYNLILSFFKDNKPIGPFCYANRNTTKEILKNTKISRLIAGFIFNKLIRFYLKIDSKDTQAGFKFINKKIFNNSNKFISENYMYDVELFLLAKDKKISPISIEVKEINTVSSSNINLFSDSIEMFFSLQKIKKHYFHR